MPCNGTCRSCSADRTFDGNDRTQNMVGTLRMALQGPGLTITCGWSKKRLQEIGSTGDAPGQNRWRATSVLPLATYQSMTRAGSHCCKMFACSCSRAGVAALIYPALFLNRRVAMET